MMFLFIIGVSVVHGIPNALAILALGVLWLPRAGRTTSPFCYLSHDNVCHFLRNPHEHLLPELEHLLPELVEASLHLLRDGAAGNADSQLAVLRQAVIDRHLAELIFDDSDLLLRLLL
jgi:hypothetical protein